MSHLIQALGLVEADVFSELGHTLLRELERFPHDHQAPHRIFRFLADTPPIFITGVLALVGVAVLTFRRWRKQTLLALLGLFFASFFVLSSGRAVIRAAIKLPLSDRPACLADAVVHGAVWDSSKLKETPNCRPQNPHITASRDLVDTGRGDGTLSGPIQSDAWHADVSVPSPSSSWKAVSVDRSGNRWLYLVASGAAYRVSPCPTLPAASAQAEKDTTGVSLVDLFAARAVSSDFHLFVTEATTGIAKSRYPHVYRFTDARGETTGYLLPASGQHGDCAVLTGPYKAAQIHRDQPDALPKTAARASQLDAFAGRLNVVDLAAG